MESIRVIIAIVFFGLGAILLMDTLGSLTEYLTKNDLHYILFNNGPALKGKAILFVIVIELLLSLGFIYIAKKIYDINNKQK